MYLYLNFQKELKNKKKTKKGSNDNVKNMSQCWINSNIFKKKGGSLWTALGIEHCFWLFGKSIYM